MKRHTFWTKPIKQYQIDQQNNFKICTKCNQTRPLNEFRFRKIQQKYSVYNSKCKPCEHETSRSWAIKNPEKTKEIKRKTNKKNRSTIQGKLNANISSAISESLSYNKNGKSWKNLVNYTIEDLKSHLEKQFTTNMSWDNYGKYWHIHHILPKALFKYEKPEEYEFKICWSLNNLAPKNYSENCSEVDMLDNGKLARNLTEEERINYLKSKGFYLSSL